MTLGIEELHKLVKENKLVENLSQRELKNPEGAGFDLRVGELFEITGQGFLGVTERETPDMTSMAKYEEGLSTTLGVNKTVEVALKPQTYYIIKTVESVNMPEDLLAIMTPRSTLFRSGVYVFGGQVPPGYCGELNMGMYNFRQEEFRLEMGARVVHIMFSEVRGKGNMYRGQWQGGRTTTENRETQV
jgi:deoxycytidine triphosphate deaminase